MIRFNCVTPASRQSLGCQGPFYVIDLDHRSFFYPTRWEGDDLVLEPLFGGPIALHVGYAPPGFGRIVLTDDNSGAGYRPEGGHRLLLEELVWSQLARCERWLERVWANGDADPGTDRPASKVAALAECLHGSAVGGGRLVALGEDSERGAFRTCLRCRSGSDALLSATLCDERFEPYAIGVGPDWPERDHGFPTPGRRMLGDDVAQLLAVGGARLTRVLLGAARPGHCLLRGGTVSLSRTSRSTRRSITGTSTTLTASCHTRDYSTRRRPKPSYRTWLQAPGGPR